MKARVENITPYKALLLLESNTRNRKMRKERVDMYTRDMREGRWRTNGESIVVTESGVLVDGQHRLQAVVNSGITVQMVVSTVPDSEAQYYDIGRGRLLYDSIKISGDGLEEITSRVSKAAIFILKMNSKNQPSEAEKKEFLKDNKELLLGFQGIIKCGQKTFSQSAVIAALICAYRNGYSAAKLKQFFEVLCSGLPESKDEFCIIYLRNAIMQMKDGGAESTKEKFNRTCYALHAYEKGLKSKFEKTKVRDYYPWD